MMTVFIGGSRAVSRLNLVIRAKLDDLICRNCAIFVGDANGADKAVQQHLAQRGYRNVVVYCMDRCRNNIGQWSTRQLSRPRAQKDFAYYAAKDLAMAGDAKCGVMLWDGKSKGTLNKHPESHPDGKEDTRLIVYLAPEKAFYKLSSEEDLRALPDRCDKDAIDVAQKQIRGKISAATQLSLQPTHS